MIVYPRAAAGFEPRRRAAYPSKLNTRIRFAQSSGAALAVLTIRSAIAIFASCGPMLFVHTHDRHIRFPFNNAVSFSAPAQLMVYPVRA